MAPHPLRAGCTLLIFSLVYFAGDASAQEAPQEPPEERVPAESDPNPLLVLDFKTRFPHKFWVSSWASDQSYPDGFRYKLLSARDEAADTVELVLVLEEPGALKTEMSRLSSSLEAFDRVASTFVNGLSESYLLEFSLLDLTTVRSPEEFERTAAESGWREWSP